MSKQLTVVLKDSLYDKLEKARGDQPRNAFVREAIETKLLGQALPLDPPGLHNVKGSELTEVDCVFCKHPAERHPYGAESYRQGCLECECQVYEAPV